MDQAKLDKILHQHKLWLDSKGEQGQRADLTGANLAMANLTRADLTKADLTRANLILADLRRANLILADLRRANLTKADLTGADLRWAYLTEVDLTRANLREANLTGAIYDVNALRSAKNVPEKYLQSEKTPQDNDIYKQRIAEAEQQSQQYQNHIKQLEKQLKDNTPTEEKDRLENELESTKKSLANTQQQLQKNQSKVAILKELEIAIQPIEDAIKLDKKTVKYYKIQSWVLLIGGVSCFVGALVFIGCRVFFPELMPNISNSKASETFNLLQIAPGFILALFGTALLRHDWKIRQLALKLIDQNNAVDIAMGMLTTSLRLSNIGDTTVGKNERENKVQQEGIPDMVKETFTEVRKALLYRNKPNASDPTDQSSTSEVLNLLAKVASNKSKTPTS